MTSIDSVLETYGNGINADDFADQLGDVMRRRVAADPRALSLHDRQVLTTVGVPAADLDRQPTRSLVVKPPECWRRTRWRCRRPPRPNALAGR